MSFSKENTLLMIIGLYLFGFVLEMLSQPINYQSINPYFFLEPQLFANFPFTTAMIIVKTIALFCSPLWLFSFFDGPGYTKPSALLILASLMQLYAIQAIRTSSQAISTEWSLALATAGLCLLVPTAYYYLRAIIVATHQSLASEKIQQAIKEAKSESDDDRLKNLFQN